MMNPFKKYYRKLRVLLRGATSALIFKLKYPQGFDSSDALLIFGAPRSGSTWLAEIVSSLPGYCQVFEPLYPVYVKEAGVAGVKINMYLGPHDDWHSGREFLEQVLSGRLMNSWLASQISLRKALQARRLVVKFVRGNMMLGWVCQNFNVKPPVLVIRHPCAVVSSLLQKNWTPGKDKVLSNPYFRQHADILEKCQKLNTAEELNALTWCLHYHAPLSLPKPYPFVLICYEKLVKDGETEIKRLFSSWRLELPSEIAQQLQKPSDTSTPTSQIKHGSDPLTGWRNRLNNDQIENILGVVDMFGMNFYSEHIEPDYEALEGFWDNQNDVKPVSPNIST